MKDISNENQALDRRMRKRRGDVIEQAKKWALLSVNRMRHAVKLNHLGITPETEITTFEGPRGKEKVHKDGAFYEIEGALSAAEFAVLSLNDLRDNWADQ